MRSWLLHVPAGLIEVHPHMKYQRGRAMVQGSFQCQSVLLLRHMVGQGPAVLAAGAGWVDYFSYFFYISSILSSFSNASSVELDILKYCGLGRYNPALVVSYHRRRAR